MDIRHLGSRGFSLIELLIASLMLTIVLGGAGAVYVSGARFLGSMNQLTVEGQPPTLNAITKRIDLGNQATVSNSGYQLNIQCDCNPDLSLQTDGPGVNDTWFHIGIVNGATSVDVRWAADNNPTTTVSSSDEVLYSKIDKPNSSFTLVNPSGQGTATVVQTTLAFTSPKVTLKTQNALGAGAKQ